MLLLFLPIKHNVIKYLDHLQRGVLLTKAAGGGGGWTPYYPPHQGSGASVRMGAQKQLWELQGEWPDDALFHPSFPTSLYAFTQNTSRS